MEEPLGEHSDPAVGAAERGQVTQRVALLRGAPPMPALDDRYGLAVANLFVGLDVGIPEVAAVQPAIKHLPEHRLQVRITRRVADVGERGEDPMCAAPLGVWPTVGDNPTIFQTACQEPPYPR